MKPIFAIIAASAALGFAAAIPDPVKPDPNMENPIPVLETVFIEDMTWIEVRDAMKSGKDTVIVATGGVEQNGPYLVTGKHNVVLRGTTRAIANQLGNALVAPIIGFVPEGDIDPPSLHMHYPGTISVTEETYRALISDVCASLKQHGFKNIVLIGDSGGNQEGLKDVAAKLNTAWDGGTTKIHYIAEYYDFPAVDAFLQKNGIEQTPEGWHDDFGMTATMMSVDRHSVRTDQRIEAGKASINGVDLEPIKETIKWGRKVINFRARRTVVAIKKAIGS